MPATTPRDTPVSRPLRQGDADRPPLAGLRGAIARQRVRAAVAIVVGDVAIVAVAGVLAKAVLPPLPQLPDFIAQVAGIVFVVGLLTALGWWRAAGFNGPARWRELHLLWLPAVVLVVAPLVRGVRPLDGGTLAFLLAGYALTGFYEEALFRGVVLRALQPRGPVLAAVVSSLLFGAAHVVNLLFRPSPFLVVAQMVGAGTSAVGLAALRLRTNTIWPLIALHMLEDLLLRVTYLPPIPVNVAQSVILLAYGIVLLRDCAPQQPEVTAVEAVP